MPDGSSSESPLAVASTTQTSAPGSSQYSNVDIDNTNWQYSIDRTQTAVSFYARDQ
jgi:hypothetical protein